MLPNNKLAPPPSDTHNIREWRNTVKRLFNYWQLNPLKLKEVKLLANFKLIGSTCSYTTLPRDFAVQHCLLVRHVRVPKLAK